MNASRSILLVQLPIPPAGPGVLEGNVPLAAAYLKLYARRQGLEPSYAIDLFPTGLANTLGDQALVEAILARQPWMVGFSCYLWNIERTMWVAQRLKQNRSDLIVLVGGPEITADNDLALPNPAVDYAVLGEGEQTFAELLKSEAMPQPRPCVLPAGEKSAIDLDAISSPYVEGILDLADDGRMSLETARGCRYRCKYCYYPKSHRGLRFLSPEQILTNLNHAVEHGATEVVLLDPTLNQRPDFADFLRLLHLGNPEQHLTFSGELRAEGIDAHLARLLREANFHEVEIGLQSIEPQAWKLMGRSTNLLAFEQGVKAIMGEGIKARVDLIVGLPGDTVDSVRRGIEFLHGTGAYSETQVFNLSILPGTAFRREADQLGLRYQPWPPYYVLQTPTLELDDIYELMEEAQDAFGVEFDSLPPPQLDSLDNRSVCRIDLDAMEVAVREVFNVVLPTLTFTLWLRSADFDRQRQKAVELIGRLLADNPHTTLQIVLEPTDNPERLTTETLELLFSTCYRTTTYLDRYYSLHPGRLLGSKRLVVVLPQELQCRPNERWRQRIAEYATLLLFDQRR